MIDINLLPPGMRKQVRLSALTIEIPREITLGAGATFVILLVIVNLILAAGWGYQGFVLAGKKASWEKLQPSRKMLDDINRESTDIRNKVSSMNKGSSSKSTDWSRRLNILSDTIVKGMWFKRLSVDSKSFLLEGYAVSRIQSDMTTVNSYVASLRKDSWFMKDLSSLEVNGVFKEKRGLVDVSKYSITGKFK